MDIKILVATHKRYWMPSDDVYLPIHVGREGKEDLGYMGDNTGENISNKNANYCELTGLYWAWKNLKCDFIGLCHYRRYFSINDIVNKIKVYKKFKDVEKYIFKKADYEHLLKDYDIILPQKVFSKKLTMYESYKKDHHIRDLDECYKIICELYPEYKSAFNSSMNKKWFYPANMFVMKREYFNNYMEWLFKILFELEKRIDISDYDNYQARIYGFLSERLFTVWLEKNNLNKKEVTMLFVEEFNLPFATEANIFRYYRRKIKVFFKNK